MPLPKRNEPPKANPNGAKVSTEASRGKSRLPALPQGGLKTPKRYDYLDLPKGQDKGFYLLRLDVCAQFTSEKNNLDKLKMVYTVLDTNCEGVRLGSTVSTISSMQGDGALYFWQEFAPPCIALAGGEVNDETLAAFAEDREATFAEVEGENSVLKGAIARVNLRRALVEKTDRKTGEPTGEKVHRVYRDWEPATDEELAKYAEK